MAQPDNVWLSQTISDGLFQLDVHSLFWLYCANRGSVWFYSSSASFITLWESFISCWLVFFITFLQGFLLGFWTWDIGWFLVKEILLGSRSPPPLWSPPRSFKMQLWVNAYEMMHFHDVVMHMVWCNATCVDAMHKFYSTSSLNTWFTSST
jgi:hypothetical protein